MKHKCNIIKDLIPLYLDEVCSEDSKKIVTEHLEECEECKKYLESMKCELTSDSLSDNDNFTKQKTDSINKAKKKMSKKERNFIIIGLIAGLLCCILFRKIIIATVAVALLFVDSVTTKVERYDDVSKYSEYFGSTEDMTFSYDSTIFPDEITDDMFVCEFEYIYYNPFDPQYVVYLTVEYDDEGYASEIERLENEGIWEKYTNYYSVTGEPDGYDFKAVHASSEGFDYAIVPENEDNTITYVGIKFCNYFLDLDIHDYLPDEYLPEGFDATMGNPYEKQKINPAD